MHRRWTHYAAPAAFLLAVTVVVLLVRSAINGEPEAVTIPTVRTVAPSTVGTATTKKPKPKPARPAPTARFYTVVAGDTFGVISSKTGVSVARIEQLNPNVESTALYIGQRIRIR